MEVKINKEEIFRADKNQFAVAATTCGYTLAYSADGETWEEDTDAVVASGKNLAYIGAVAGMLYKLSGNTDDGVTIIK